MNQQKRNVILGIDPGTRITGYGVISKEGNTLRALDYGCIRPPPDAKLSERYLIIHESLDQLIQTYGPDAIVVETQYVHKNPQSALKLGMARGMVLLSARKKRIPIYEYSPARVKKAVVGNGRASKEQIQGMMKMRLQLAQIPEPDDPADALALAVCHAQALFTPEEI